MIDIQTHRGILLNILKDIYSHPQLSAQLGFKGGTALYFFFELPRFSTDLDFNIMPDEKDFSADQITGIVEKYVTLTDHSHKHHSWLWEGSYKKTLEKVKIEIGKRHYPDEYSLQNLYGITVQCLKDSFMFAHKLCAIIERKNLTNRDLFDAHFMFQKQFPIAHNIIQFRTGLSTKEYFDKLADYIPQHISQRGILDGLGIVLSEEQKRWVKKSLVTELLFFLKSWRS